MPPPKLVGRGLGVMIQPLPKTKRKPNPRGKVNIEETEAAHTKHESKDEQHDEDGATPENPDKVKIKGKKKDDGDFQNNPFDKLDESDVKN